jgi:hypothetical protein
VDKPTASRIDATSWVREMDQSKETGGSQPHLFETTDVPHMVKTLNNPQGPHVPVNELVGSLCLAWLDVIHPPGAIVDIADDLLQVSSGAKFHDGTRLAAGPAFGSAYWQSDPESAVDASTLRNVRDIAGTAAYDTWVRNHDGRQYRVRAANDEPGKYDYIPVDQGHSFGAPAWTREALEGDRSVTMPPTPVSLAGSVVAPFVERLRQFTSP